MTRSIIRRVDWTCSVEPNSPHPAHQFECTKCGERGQADDLFERARDFVFQHVGGHPSHTGFREVVTRHWRMFGEDVDQPPADDQQSAPGWVVKPEALAYAEHLRGNPGKASSDGHTGWQCAAGAAWLVGADTPGPGKLGTHHGVIYACTEHKDAAAQRIAAGGYDVDLREAPTEHRWNPWPCGHVTAYNAAALTAFTSQQDVDELPERSGATPCPECSGRGVRVLPTSSAETECSSCRGTGHAGGGPECLGCHDVGCADCGRVSLPSAPTPEYGAPYVPTYTSEYAVPVPPMSMGPVDTGAPESAERY